MLDNETLQILRKALESKEHFEPLLNFFVQVSLKEREQSENPSSYSNIYSRFIGNYSKINTNLIFENCQSPIERMFVSSLLLLFIKNGILGFTVTPKLDDAEMGMKIYRENHEGILNMVDSYKKSTGDLNLKNFESTFKELCKTTKYEEEDFNEICHHYYIVKNFTYNSFYITLQPQFPNYKINNCGIRPDILIWSPGKEKIKLIIECDGFEFHKSKKSFINDRQRDRLLKMNGYDVLRY
jgi:hypothetical protein